MSSCSEGGVSAEHLSVIHHREKYPFRDRARWTDSVTDEDLSKHFHPRQPQKQSVTELGHLLTCESKQTNRVSRSLLSARLASILRRLSLSVCLVFIVVSIFGCQTSINVVFGRPKVTQ